ncbi:hatching enzyme 1.2-like isoform X1 [Channa argus]|uniref:hatching enzyme 1.2-like isoform X1 n=2 Tax=Channa argus TaxID=215402 RepID=UPI003521DA31
MMTPVFLLLLSVMLIPSSLLPIKSGELVSVQNETLDAFQVIAKANANLTNTLTHGDIMPNRKRNADPCTAIGCKWPKTGSYVYVPVVITGDFSAQERDVIIGALVSFHQSTCIRFVWRSTEADYLIFYSGTGCWSYVGRQRNQQPISLQRNGCIYYSTVQHEVIHALGFHHEHVRSDRDSYVNIYTQNVQTGMESNFMKVQTNNLGTPYDFNSVMHYPNYAFSKNGLPTISAKSNPNMVLGGATQMSSNDIARINRLYQCCE